MEQLDVFISVGDTATDEQEAFVRAIEERLRNEGLIPHTIGRNTFSSDAPLSTVTDVMSSCSGTVIIALERMYFPSGIGKRGGTKETALSNVKLATPWNQIEAAMAYSRGHPMLVIIEKELKQEGLLESNFNWYVQRVVPTAASLNTSEFNGVLASWKLKVAQYSKNKKEPGNGASEFNSAELTIGQLVKGLKPAQFWSVLTALLVLITGAFNSGWFGQRFLHPTPDKSNNPAKAVDSVSKPTDLSLKPISADITGKWEYRSSVINKGDQPGSVFGWGGVVEITMKPTPYHVEFKLTGQREWIDELVDKKGTLKRSVLNPPYAWESDWGTITSENAIKLTYDITTDRSTIRGFISGYLRGLPDISGKPQSIESYFFQMSPNSPLYGDTSFRRMASDNDRIWK
ncbi:MAG TPA: hypothetical protein VHC44_19665 [Verrucomicrobiae bacterium]|nr:hypothetical protein [Verrucomicrobiae bacterium]